MVLVECEKLFAWMKIANHLYKGRKEKIWKKNRKKEKECLIENGLSFKRKSKKEKKKHRKVKSIHLV